MIFFKVEFFFFNDFDTLGDIVTGDFGTPFLLIYNSPNM